MKRFYISNRLFAEPSFVEGMARVLDIGGTLQRYNTEHDPDAIAIKNDWRAVGDDLKSSIGLYEQRVAKAI
ncbi:MAG: hypothetical protein G01um101417_511 [Parcubacteria group bacterium Gr01-1014_17]|nr:MAG: hypothetical protein G01um101417_511 [Parcubacteria group bacterium Gr01-1014_17]